MQIVVNLILNQEMSKYIGDSLKKLGGVGRLTSIVYLETLLYR